MKTRVAEMLCLYYMNICLACVIHNTYMQTLIFGANSRSWGRPARLPSRHSDGFWVWSQHHPQTRTLSLTPHWYRRQFLAILCTLSLPLCHPVPPSVHSHTHNICRCRLMSNVRSFLLRTSTHFSTYASYLKFLEIVSMPESRSQH